MKTVQIIFVLLLICSSIFSEALVDSVKVVNENQEVSSQKVEQIKGKSNWSYFVGLTAGPSFPTSDFGNNSFQPTSDSWRLSPMFATFGGNANLSIGFKYMAFYCYTAARGAYFPYDVESLVDSLYSKKFENDDIHVSKTSN